MSDLRYALRTLSRSPGFASVAILSLALGIGATAAIYSVIRAVLLDPLPVRAPQELVAVGWNSKGVRMPGIRSINSTSYHDERSGRDYSSNFSYSLYRAFQRAAGPGLFAFSYAGSDVNVSFAGQPLVASSLLVSGNYFAALGAATILGRPLGDMDDKPDAAPVAVITDSFWKRTFGGDPNVLQRTIHLNGSPFAIVGVTAPGFYGMSKGGLFFKPTDVFLPMSEEPVVYTRSTPRSLFDADDRWWVQVMARMPPGASVARLETALNVTFRNTLAGMSVSLHDANTADVGVIPAPKGLDSWTRGLREPLLILGIVVGVVLLIACVNVGNLMLVRGVARQKELSIRLALGSSRWRLVRATLVEGVVLATAGGALGTLVGVWGARTLLATMVGDSTRTALTIGFDHRLVGAATLASAIAAVLFSALPVVRTVRGGIAPVLKRAAVGASVPHVAGRIVMATQVAISVPLLVGAVLFLRTAYNLGQVDLGFNPERLLIFHIDPSLSAYDADRTERLYGQLLQRLAAMPGVAGATISDIVPISRVQNNWTFLVPGSEPKNVKFVRIGPAYFETLGIPVVAGRTIGVQDHSGAPGVAVVNETAVRTLFGAHSAIGRRLTMTSDPPADFEVVGVVKDSRYTSPRDPMPPTVYLPYAQTTLGRLGPMNVIVRSIIPPSALSGLIKAAVADVDRNIPVTDLRTQADQIDETLGTERTFMRLLLAFGAFALLLASIGLHGITAYAVVRRTSEIGVRVALGARQIDVLWLILRQVVAITIVGLAVGVAAALVSARLIRASLYGVGPADPVSIAAAATVMMMVAVTAGFFPARRAARLDALAALRYQ